MKDHLGLALLSFTVIAVLCGSLEAQSTCAQANKRPRINKSVERGIMSLGACEDLCTDRVDCIYFSWKTNKRCYLSDLIFVDTTNGGGGKKNCDCTSGPPPPPPTPPFSCKCGLANHVTTTASNKIVGGEQTGANKYPWQVGVTYPQYPIFFCGGSLISDQWVLTAAHCTVGDSPEDLKVVLGEHNTNLETEPTLSLGVQKIVNHPSYIESEFNYDFSLLKLKNKVDFEAYTFIRPVCLPTSASNDYAGDMAITTGWGLTSAEGSLSDFLQEVTLQVLSNEDCSDDYYEGYIEDQMVCAGREPGKANCNGDSGGPLISSGTGDGVTPGQNYELVGVVSWGEISCSNFPTVFARVSTVLGWIQENVFDTGSQTCPRTTD